MNRAILLSTILAIAPLAQAQIIEFDFLDGEMNAAQEGGGVISTAIGIESGPGITYDDASNTLSVNATFQDLTLNANNAHVHGPGPPGLPGVIVFPLTFSPATSGTISGFNSIPLTQPQEDNLMAGLYYVNLHSDTYPGGEIRGQLVPVPEPEPYAAVVGAALVGFALWRRRQ